MFRRDGLILVQCSGAAAIASGELLSALTAIATETFTAARLVRAAPEAAVVISTDSSDGEVSAESSDSTETVEDAKPKRAEAPTTINLLMQVCSDSCVCANWTLEYRVSTYSIGIKRWALDV